jgi:sensor domain CHASE-containing protein
MHHRDQPITMDGLSTVAVPLLAAVVVVVAGVAAWLVLRKR